MITNYQYYLFDNKLGIPLIDLLRLLLTAGVAQALDSFQPNGKFTKDIAKLL
ncbi:MAG: hypothetical protein JNL49_07195 [Bacteroidia bacterium]|nr:hypothetical protein [Bacteroidia bacterium]